MPITVYNINRIKILIEDKPLAAPGGEGSVHKVITNPQYPNTCIKIYHPLRRTRQKKSKIDFMIKNKPASLFTRNFILCWPEEMIYDNSGNFLGFIMPIAFSGSIKLYELVTTKLNPTFLSDWSKFERTRKTGIEKRLKICVNISIALHSIHSSGKYSMVDYKPQNILITNEGKISITDVDSFQISENNKVIFHAEVATPEYAPPESARLNPSNSFIPDNWDRFSFAVSFYEILFGIHPFAATCDGQYLNATTIGEKIQKGLFVHGSKKNYLTVIPSLHSNFNTLPSTVKNLFIKAFEDGHTNPNSRPQPHIWGQTIVSELTAGNTIKPNTISTVRQPKTTSTKTSIKKPTYQPVSSSTNRPINKTIPKKEDYMIWKILTTVFIIISIALFVYNQNTNKEIESLKRESSFNETQKNNLQSQLTQLQNNKASNQSYYISRISELEGTIQDLGGKYPLSILSISFRNVDNSAKLLKSESYTFSKSELKYIQPVIKYNSNLQSNTETTVYYKIYDPNGNLLSASTSPSGYTWYGTFTVGGSFLRDNIAALNAFGLSSDCPYYCITGKHKVEFWCKGIMIGESSFTITEY